ncbi:MAG TPA: DUF2497 domain-containing protein [Rhodoblastus sp.]|nr:DUF2497 domain-containing protein [Rhodoblastus sp.]
MDDILASIRRIIADDDALPLSRPVRGAAAPAVSAPTAQASAAAEPAPAAFQQAPAVAAPPPVAPTPPPPSPVASAADALLGLGQRLFRGGEAVAATASVSAFRPPVSREAPKAPSLKLRDFAPKDGPALRPSPVEPVAEAPAAPPAAKMIPVEAAPPAKEPAPVAVAPAATVASLAEARLKAAPQAPRPAVIEPQEPNVAAPAQAEKAAPEPAPKSSPSSEKPPAEPHLAEQPAEPARPAARRVPAPPPAVPGPEPEPALLSPASGARIGASFEALAESLILRDPDMIERLAREMLRPMLKSWLDDNLPIVVERLVRAEIERIARGRG